MQTQGSLQEANLASLLQTMQSERATGTLSLENGPSSASLYFLFGHLFHASDASRQGEEVVVDALTWQQGSFQFDPRAKLPAEETIKSSPADLIAEAEQRGGVATAAAPPAEPAAADTGSSWAAAPPAETPTWGAPADTGAAPAAAEESTYNGGSTWGTSDSGTASWGAPAETPAEAPAETPAEAPAEATAESQPADTGYSWAPPSEPPAEAPAEATQGSTYSWGTPAAEPEATAEAEPTTDSGSGYSWAQPAAEAPAADDAAPTWQAQPAAAPEAEAVVEPEATAQPEPVAEAAAPATAAPATAVPLSVMYPLPSGKTTYEGLKSAFVDFPKLLRTLKGDAHTGYVHLESDGFSGTLVFQGGNLIEALADASGEVSQGETAFQLFRRHMDAGAGHLDVVDLSDDIVGALGQLFAGVPMFQGLLGRFVNFDALIEYLEEETITGSVVLTGGSEMGVILLNAGEVLGAYTESSPTPDTKLATVSALAKELTAHIDVRSGAGTVPGLDIEAQLAQPL